jgi:hypothetical protein
MIREAMDALAACRAWPGSVKAIAGCRRQAFEAGATVGSMPTRLKMHPDVSHLAFLLGAWRGMGTGGYPTVQPFAYEEVLTFSHVAKPYLIMQQRTFIVSGDGRTPSHMEFAFWRPAGERAVEVVSTHPNGVVEIETGIIEGGRILLGSTSLVRTPTAKDITQLEREISVTSDVMVYDVRMEAMGQPLQHHLHAKLRRSRWPIA